ncbi:MAG: biotin/lipoyl-binding protein [Opitutaceae bacterium]|nr:biotin/lipoyl-binding protein [Opitutaceae bacterium]
MKKLRITVEGKSYEVLVETLDASSSAAPAAHATSAHLPAATPVFAPAAPAAKQSGASAGPGVVTCPLSGKVVTVDVKVGDTVTPEQALLTIEAMKMNTYIYAPQGGTVTEVLVKAGDSVEEGSVLVRLG